jgi:hypothetical protein
MLLYPLVFTRSENYLSNEIFRYCSLIYARLTILMKNKAFAISFFLF